MGKKLFAFVFGAALLVVAGTAPAQQWLPGDDYKMHFPQYPNEYGWNVHNGLEVIHLADDWECIEPGTVNDIHFWGSWQSGDAGTINGFTITIYDDIPADQSPFDYSMPGAVVWGPVYISSAYFEEYHILPDPEAWEGWYDPLTSAMPWPDHNNFYQYDINDIGSIPGIAPPFVQTEGAIYWLEIAADVEDDGTSKHWGWKSSYRHFNDDAVRNGAAGGPPWIELLEPDLGATYNSFHVEVNTEGNVVEGSGEFAWNDTWYFYDDDGEWWNIWFYDHPLNYDRWKEVHVTGSVVAADPAIPGDIVIAVNWSTPAWSWVGNPPGEPRRPPMNEDIDPLNPVTYIERFVIYQGPVSGVSVDIGNLGYNINDYNPEWVSIDVRGTNFVFDGAITHQCIGEQPESMDLAFVISGEPLPDPVGACCWPDGNCTVETQSDCEAVSGIDGTYMGDGTVCAGDGDGNGIDDLCDNVTPMGACCAPDGACYRTYQATCEGNSHTYMGHGTACVGDTDGDGYDETCDAPPGACCLPGGTCVQVDAATCLGQNGDYQGDGTPCLGDGNSNGIDDACEEAGELKWFQPPDLDVDGMDVSAYYIEGYDPYVLATDFECTSTGPITEIHIFGSWYLDKLPYDDPTNVHFNLSLHEDITASQSGTGYSMPGAQLCYLEDVTFDVKVYAEDLQEGWFEPPDTYTMYPLGDRVCWEYTFYLDGSCTQAGTPSAPIIYWVDVQAYPDDPTAFWGWKTTREEWNDWAVWAIGEDAPGANPTWNELRLPSSGWMYTPGDVDDDGDVDMDDVLYLADYMTQQGPPPVYYIPGTNPPFYAAADVDGNCIPGQLSDLQRIAAWLQMSIPLDYCSAYPPGTVPGRPLDLAMAIYGPAVAGAAQGACCHSDGNCTLETQADCESAVINGTYLGDGTVCLDDNDGDGIDDACGATVIRGACCLQDGGCIVAQESYCLGLSGTYLGDNTVCLGDADGNGVDDACETPVNRGACCWIEGGCSVTTAANCVENGGTYLGDNTACLGDADGNGVDDACEEPDPDFKWEQLPDTDPTGFDVNASFYENQPYILADDFECTVTGPITRIHVYGSWFADRPPFGHPNLVQFVLSIHEDIPADPGDPTSFSRPGNLLCLLTDLPFEVQPYATDLQEGWFDPPDDLRSVGDKVCWEYIFYLPPDLCIQEGTTTNPVVYWLDVQAYPVDNPEGWLPSVFGWKSSLQHWNDDATWGWGQDGGAAPVDWQELIYPSDHPFAGQSVDLAFKIIGSEGTPTPTGACCWPDGTCTVGTQADCENSPFGVIGTYQGDGTPCQGDQNGNGVDDACEVVVPTGACCWVDPAAGPSCVNTSQAQCLALPGGNWYPGQNCNEIDFVCPTDPPQGACCWEDAAGNMTCTNTTKDECTAAYGGTWYLGQDCATFDCPTPQPMGACCYGDPAGSFCVNTTEDQCKKNYNGDWYPGQDCASADFSCPTYVEMGACCYVESTVGPLCVNTTQADCLESYGGAWYPGQDCADFDCPGPEPEGACCYGDPASPLCINTTQNECYVAYGGTWYLGQDCVNFECPVPQELGACCFGDADNPMCATTTQVACLSGYGGTWYPGQDCSTFDCPSDPIGACCFEHPQYGTSCVDTYQYECLQLWGGTWYLGQDCSTFECPTTEPQGACCYGDPAAPSCINTTHAECLSAYGGTWYANTDCNSFTCPVPPDLGACCIAGASGLFCVGDMPQYICQAYFGGNWHGGQTCADITDCVGADPIGACCYLNAASGLDCANTTEANCNEAYGGTWYGGQDCATFECPTAVTGACCYDNGSCTDDMTQADCVASGGDYGGDGTNCANADSDQNGIDDFCDDIVNMGACCYNGPDPGDDSPYPAMVTLCVNTTQTVCGQIYHGMWYAGEDCATFTCPEGEGLKWMQPPDLTTTGMDVNVMSQRILADDFECIQTGPITKVDIWGSWWMDEYPNAGPGDISFTLSIHEDIPSTSTLIYPVDCPYLTATGSWNIIEGLPQGSEINAVGTLSNFDVTYREPGGQYGGEIVYLAATLELQMVGTNVLGSFSHTVQIPVQCEVQTSCVPAEPCGTVESEIVSLELTGELPPGDLEFAHLQVSVGEAHGLPPSLGELTGTGQPGGTFFVDSFFDITYKIEFTGEPGGALEGMSGVTEGPVRMEQADPTGGPCEVPNEGVHSMPAEPICVYNFVPGEFDFVPEVEPGTITEGWFDPTEGDYVFPGDHNCWKYTFTLPGDCIQQGQPNEPVVYWLDIQADYASGQESVYFGWKTSLQHWNDDAVWAAGIDPHQMLSPWFEMWYPSGHQLVGQSVDLAFAIYGEAEVDTCLGQMPGDYDNDGDIDSDDLDALTAYVDGTGSPASPPANGDFNGDCRVNAWDVNNMTAYLTSGLPLPADCTCLDPFRTCCIGTVGNVNLDRDELVTIGDISFLIDHLFITGARVPCETEADINQSGGLHPVQGPGGDLTIGDISILIDHLFISGPAVVILKDCF